MPAAMGLLYNSTFVSAMSDWPLAAPAGARFTLARRASIRSTLPRRGGHGLSLLHVLACGAGGGTRGTGPVRLTLTPFVRAGLEVQLLPNASMACSPARVTHHFKALA